MRILVDDAISGAEQAFGGFGDLLGLPGRAITPSSNELREAEVLIVRSVTRVDANLLAAAPNLRFVGTATAGTDHLDLDALAERGITFANAAGCNAQAVAEWVLVALLTVSARLPEPIARGPIGVVGVGEVGSRLVALLRRFGRWGSVLGCDPARANRGDPQESWLTLDELWSRCSIVSLHVPLITDGPEPTLGLIDQAAPALSRPKLLINTSRGAVVPDRALARADVHARVLDVYEHEPNLDSASLLDGRSWLLSPHVAGYSLEAKLRATSMMHAALAEWLGCPASFDAVAALPDLRVEGGGLPEDPDAALLALLHRIVDQPGDDRRMRALFELSEIERAAAFEQLRRGYALRREFAGCVVEDAPTDLIGSLTTLGLRT